MYSLILSFLAFAGVMLAFRLPEPNVANIFWTIVWSVLAFLIVFATVNWIIRGRLMKVMGGIQAMLYDGQQRLKSKINDFQNHPKGDPNKFLAQVQKSQRDLINDAVAMTSDLEPYRNWVPFFGRQINTTRMQFYYQLQEFDKVDELLPKCLVIDPLTGSMKMARQFQNNASLEDIEKTFRKAKMRTRYDQSGLLYATLSWIYVKRGKIDDAYSILVEGCKNNSVTEGVNSTLARNRDLLANNRPREFNNSGFGDQWYALMLEQPKIRYERRAPTRFGKFG